MERACALVAGSHGLKHQLWSIWQYWWWCWHWRWYWLWWRWLLINGETDVDTGSAIEGGVEGGVEGDCEGESYSAFAVWLSLPFRTGENSFSLIVRSKLKEKPQTIHWNGVPLSPQIYTTWNSNWPHNLDWIHWSCRQWSLRMLSPNGVKIIFHTCSCNWSCLNRKSPNDIIECEYGFAYELIGIQIQARITLSFWCIASSHEPKLLLICGKIWLGLFPDQMGGDRITE